MLQNWKKPLVSVLTAGTVLTALAMPAFAASYVIQPNDTLWKISQSQHVSLQSLEAANPNINPYQLQIGQTLSVPTQTYTATDSDTFWTISRKFNVSLSALVDANPNVNPQNIYAGLAIHIPQQGTLQASVMSVSPAAVIPSGNSITTASGQTAHYSKEISGVATAYTAAPSENGQWGAVDYMGNPLKLGTIAVDPSVIPLGSTVYITGYSYNGLPTGGMIAHATDEGGAIKGNRIDIFLPTGQQAADNFGIQNVKIYVLN